MQRKTFERFPLVELLKLKVADMFCDNNEIYFVCMGCSNYKYEVKKGR